MRQRKYKYFVCACVSMYIYYFFGVGDYIYSKDFEDSFDYPLNIDIKPVVEEVIAGKKPSVNPINYYPYRFLSNSGTCATLQEIDLFIVVKSAMSHFGHRNAIRQTYAQSMQGHLIKTLFFLGIDGSTKSETQRKIEEEMAEFKDIIQIDFHDSYFNNTIKTMMSFRWVYEHCAKADFYLFTDDDMYISVKNLLAYIENKAILSKVEYDPNIHTNIADKESQNVSQAPKLDRDSDVLVGYVFNSTPQRFRTSKWRVSLEEYPWDKWPTYVTAGAYLVSNKAMKTLYAGSLFVKHFRFDDIYLGIVAKKVGIVPIHCPMFHFYKKKYSKDGYRDVIASHGYDDHDELIRVWNEHNGA